MKKIKILSITFCFSILLAIMTSASLAAVVVGERVTFDRPYPGPGDEVTPVVHLRVEGGPVNLSISYTARFSSGLPLMGTPTTGTLNTGTGTLRLSRLRIPDPAPYEICFTIYVSFVGGTEPPQLLISEACWKKNIRVAATGRSERRVLPDLASGTLPDLVVVGPPELDTSERPGRLGSGRADVRFGIANLGGTAAEGVEWKVVINYFRCVEMVHVGHLETSGLGASSSRVGTIPRIAAGETVHVSTQFNETVMTYIDSGQEQHWVPCEIIGAKIELDPNNRIREQNDNNTFIFPGSRTPIFE
jgi:hypothetical protein